MRQRDEDAMPTRSSSLSLEIFAPRSATGDPRLTDLMTDAAALGASLISVSGVAESAIRVCQLAIAAGLKAQLQLSAKCPRRPPKW